MVLLRMLWRIVELPLHAVHLLIQLTEMREESRVERRRDAERRRAGSSVPRDSSCYPHYTHLDDQQLVHQDDLL